MERYCLREQKDSDVMKGEERRLKKAKKAEESNIGKEGGVRRQRKERKGGTFYLNSHLRNKDGSKDVVGNCEKHPFL